MHDFKIGQPVRFIRETWSIGAYSDELPPLYSVGTVTGIDAKYMNSGFPWLWVQFDEEVGEVGFLDEELEIVEVIADGE